MSVVVRSEIIGRFVNPLTAGYLFIFLIIYLFVSTLFYVDKYTKYTY